MKIMPLALAALSAALLCKASSLKHRALNPHGVIASTCKVDVPTMHSFQTLLSRGRCDAHVVYTPAPWEVDFVTNMPRIQDGTQEWAAGCAKMRSHRSLIDEWLRLVNGQYRGAALPSSFDKEAMSYFTTTTTCPGELPRVEVEPIEPLVGFLRHPMTWCIDHSWEYMLRKEYLLLGSPASVGSGRKFFFDVGASTFLHGAGGASQSWFAKIYETVLNVNFDRIIAWEYGGSQVDRLSETPFEYLVNTSYFVIPASGELDACHNPLNFIRKLCHKDDYVVFKLDIDTPGIESAIVDQLVNDPRVAGLVDEFFYEDHAAKNPMEYHGWGRQPKDHDMAKSIQIFSKLRALGVRAHSWV